MLDRRILCFFYTCFFYAPITQCAQFKMQATHKKTYSFPQQERKRNLFKPKIFAPSNLQELVIPANTFQQNSLKRESSIPQTPATPVLEKQKFTWNMQAFIGLIEKVLQQNQTSPTYTIPNNANYPLLECFKPALSLEDITEDLRLLPWAGSPELFPIKHVSENISVETPKTPQSESSPIAQQVKVVFSATPKLQRHSFYDIKTLFKVWYSTMQPNVGIVQKIEHKSVKDWYILGDRHGDSESIDIILHFLSKQSRTAKNGKPEQLLTQKGKLAPCAGIIFCGDYIDRGNDSLGLIHRIIRLKHKNPNQVFLLKGNHEEGECGCELQKNLSTLGKKLGKRLHEQYITGFACFPEMFFLKIPNEHTPDTNEKTYLLLVHGGIETPSLDPTTYNTHMETLQNFLSSSTDIAILHYPPTSRHASLWTDFNTTEASESVLLGSDRKASVGRKETEDFLHTLKKNNTGNVELIIRAHQQATKNLFKDTNRVPGIALRFPKSNNPQAMRDLKNYLVWTLNVAPRTALSFHEAYKNKYELSFDTILHIHVDWEKQSWSANPLHFDSNTGEFTPHNEVITFFKKQKSQVPQSWIDQLKVHEK